MAIRASDAIRVARALIGTPYSELDCIGLIVRVIRTAPGGVPGYRTAGTNTLWKSYESAAKYRDLTWRQEGIQGAQAGMLVFKRSGENIHHVGLVTGEGTVIHSSSTKGCVVETELSGTWRLLAVHRYMETENPSVSFGDTSPFRGGLEEEESMAMLYRAMVTTQSDPLRVRDAPGTGRIIGHVPRGKTVDVLSSGEWPRIRYGETVGYASGAYLARVEEDVTDDPDIDVGDKVYTTLICEDSGSAITLCGKWRVASD